MFFKRDLEEYTQNANNIDELIEAFEKMCSKRGYVVDDFVFFESGNFDFSGKNEFYFSLVRQYRDNVLVDEYVQTRLEIIFPEQKFGFRQRKLLNCYFSSDQLGDSFSKFFAKLHSCELLKYIKDNSLEYLRFEIYEEET